MDRFKVEVKSIGEEFSCGGDEHLLQGMGRYRVGARMLRTIPVGCRGGGCGICKVRILQGETETKKMSIKHVTKEQQQDGFVLACRAYPRSDLQLEIAT